MGRRSKRRAISQKKKQRRKRAQFNRQQRQAAAAAGDAKPKSPARFSKSQGQTKENSASATKSTTTAEAKHKLAAKATNPSSSSSSSSSSSPIPSEPRQVLLSVQGLKTRFNTEAGVADAVNGVSFDVYEGEVLGLVGESGSGKSVCSLSMMRLIPNPPGEIYEGSVKLRGTDLLSLSWPEMRKYRGQEIAMIFQEPMTSLNPVYTIGFQLTEILFQHYQHLTSDEAFQRAVKLLGEVGIPDPARRMADYPHQFSGGMRQRVMIAMALACDPSLLIADEPTTALDVTIQAQILELMLKVKSKRKDAAILLITHDLAVVAETCERVIVLYGGTIQEIAPVAELFRKPAHPYTQGLLSSLPRPVRGAKPKHLKTIPGIVPSIHNFPKGCRFSTRCDKVEERCHDIVPELVQLSPDHWVRCHLVTEMEERVEAAGRQELSL